MTRKKNETEQDNHGQQSTSSESSSPATGTAEAEFGTDNPAPLKEEKKGKGKKGDKSPSLNSPKTSDEWVSAVLSARKVCADKERVMNDANSKAKMARADYDKSVTEMLEIIDEKATGQGRIPFGANADDYYDENGKPKTDDLGRALTYQGPGTTPD